MQAIEKHGYTLTIEDGTFAVEGPGVSDIFDSATGAAKAVQRARGLAETISGPVFWGLSKPTGGDVGPETAGIRTVPSAVPCARIARERKIKPISADDFRASVEALLERARASGLHGNVALENMAVLASYVSKAIRDEADRAACEAAEEEEAKRAEAERAKAEKAAQVAAKIAALQAQLESLKAA